MRNDCMRPKFGVEDQLKAYKDYKIHFARDMGFAFRRNALPKEIQESNTLTKFKTRLRTHLHI